MNPFIPLFPDIPSKLFQVNVNECAIKLALLTLNMSRAEYNSMTTEEMKRAQIGNEKEMLAWDILINSKPSIKKLQGRIFHHEAMI